ncbi:MAG: hypothetical protein WB783_08510 [Arenicellales bacterium]
MKTRTAFVLIFALLALPLAAQPAAARDLAGKVAAVAGKTVTIRLTSDELLPRIGDPVDISFITPDGEKVYVGSWKVSKVTGATIEATVARAQGEATPDMDAVIHSVSDFPQPKIPPGDHPKGFIPSLNAVFSDMRFYESASTANMPLDNRVYKNTFALGQDYIWWEFTLRYNSSKRIDFEVTAKYYDQNGNQLSSHPEHFYINPNDTGELYSGGLRTAWTPGNYRVDIVYQNRKIGTGSFTIK